MKEIPEIKSKTFVKIKADSDSFPLNWSVHFLVLNHLSAKSFITLLYLCTLFKLFWHIETFFIPLSLSGNDHYFNSEWGVIFFTKIILMPNFMKKNLGRQVTNQNRPYNKKNINYR